VQASRDANSAESQDMPSYSTPGADLLTANIRRSVETEEHSEILDSTIQRQSEPGRAAVAATAPPIMSIPVVQPNSVGIQRQCSECAEKQQQPSEEEGKDVLELSQAASGIQTKLTVGAIGDAYEQEADRVAAQVMSMPVAAAAPRQVQRFGVEDSPVGMYSSLARSITPVVHRRVDEHLQMRELVQRAFEAGGNEASGDLESRLNASSGGGNALAPEVRAFMEPRFGADFSSVRVHTGSEAVQMNRELGAQAFAHGSDIYFGAGKEPGNNELTAHELTHVVQQTGGVQRQNQKPQNPTISLREIPILEGIAPKSDVLSHLQSLGGTAGHDSSVYRKEILQFQRGNSVEKIAASQQQVLESAKSVDIQQKDSSQTLRRCISGCTPQSTFKEGERLGVSSNNKTGWINGKLNTGELISLHDALKVQYQENKGGRDYFTILEGPNAGKIASLKPGYLGRTPWQGPVAVTFNEKTGILNYGGGTARATIDTNPKNPSVPKIALNRAYPLQLPDYPHPGGANYGDYAMTWFRIKGGPQGDEYLHRGNVSWGCVSVKDDSWPSIYKHLINKRSDNQHIGTIKRINQ